MQSIWLAYGERKRNFVGQHFWARGKTAEAIQREIAREVDQLLRVIFSARRKTGCLDLEAVEMAVRSAMHHAGATALTELRQFPVPDADRKTLPCPCGRQAGYRELRSKSVVTVVGQVNVSRPYYLCPHCHKGHFPADEMEIQRAMQLDLPIVIGKPVPVLSVQMDGTGVPVVKKETVGRAGKTEG